VLHGTYRPMSATGTPIPRTPAGLGRRGRNLWRSVVAGFELTEGDCALLLEACRCLDTVEQLQHAVADAPLTTTGSRGQSVVHPLRAELRSERLLLAKLLLQLAVPDPDAAGSSKWDHLSTSARGRMAARARWDNRGTVKR
jgi:hypothetical protein